MADPSGLSRPLLKEVLADPPHLPETPALLAVRRLGPRARESAARVPEGEPVETRARPIARVTASVGVGHCGCGAGGAGAAGPDAGAAEDVTGG
ncbi:hypothetical protein [Streptomyces sp. JNUCC 63]